MTVWAIVYGLQQLHKQGNADLEPWMYFPATFGTFANSGGPMALYCGAVAGPDLLITLITNENAGGPIRCELAEWYGNTPLPSTDWDHLFSFKETTQSVSESAACHISRSKWEHAYLSAKDPAAGYDSTRCEKLHGDCVVKTVEMLNAWKASSQKPDAWAPDANYAGCYACHSAGLGPVEDPKLGFVKNGREDCTVCHDVPSGHPAAPPPPPETPKAKLQPPKRWPR